MIKHQEAKVGPVQRETSGDLHGNRTTRASHQPGWAGHQDHGWPWEVALCSPSSLVKCFSVGIPSTGLLPQGIQAWPLEGTPIPHPLASEHCMTCGPKLRVSRSYWQERIVAH